MSTDTTVDPKASEARDSQFTRHMAAVASIVGEKLRRPTTARNPSMAYARGSDGRLRPRPGSHESDGLYVGWRAAEIHDLLGVPEHPRYLFSPGCNPETDGEWVGTSFDAPVEPCVIDSEAIRTGLPRNFVALMAMGPERHAAKIVEAVRVYEARAAASATPDDDEDDGFVATTQAEVVEHVRAIAAEAGNKICAEYRREDGTHVILIEIPPDREPAAPRVAPDRYKAHMQLVAGLLSKLLGRPVAAENPFVGHNDRNGLVVGFRDDELEVMPDSGIPRGPETGKYHLAGSIHAEEDDPDDWIMEVYRGPYDDEPAETIQTGITNHIPTQLALGFEEHARRIRDVILEYEEKPADAGTPDPRQPDLQYMIHMEKVVARATVLAGRPVELTEAGWVAVAFLDSELARKGEAVVPADLPKYLLRPSRDPKVDTLVVDHFPSPYAKARFIFSKPGVYLTSIPRDPAALVAIGVVEHANRIRDAVQACEDLVASKS